MTITIDSKAFKQFMNRFDALERCVKTLAGKNVNPKWIHEEEAIAITGLSKSTLARKRKDGLLNYSTQSGRKIKYLRRDIEKFLDDNSTVYR